MIKKLILENIKLKRVKAIQGAIFLKFIKILDEIYAGFTQHIELAKYAIKPETSHLWIFFTKVGLPP